jgi:HlyD family secretion protein
VSARAALASLALALGLGCGGERPEVDVASVRRSALVERVSTNGTVEPVDDLELRARLDGRIVAIAEPGAQLAPGDPLVEIDAAPVAAALGAAEAERLAAEDSLRSARDELARVERRAATDRQLYEARALTRERFEESRSELAEARARVASLEREVPARVASLELRIRELAAQREAARVRAPFPGTVYRREVREGAVVRAGDALLRFADLGRLRVRANVDQVDLGRVRAGQTLLVSSNGFPGRSWRARLSEVIPDVVVKDARSVSESLAAIEAPTEGLVPGMTVDVEILVDEGRDALQVPSDSVFLAGGEHFVYRVEEGRVRRTPVRVGRTSADATEILDGLAPEDLVVTGSPDGLPDGARVEVRASDVAAERAR